MKRLLVATDGLASGARAVSFATALARRHGGDVELCYAVNVLAALGQSYIGYVDDDAGGPLDDAATEILRQALEIVRTAGVVGSAYIIDGETASSIVDHEKDGSFDALVMGTQGKRGMRLLLMGSVACRVLRSTTIPVFVLPPRVDVTKVRFERMLVAVDGSRSSAAAVDFALDFAENEGAALVVCGVAASEGRLDEMATNVLAAASARAKERGIACEAVAVCGDPGNQLLRIAVARDVDFTVVGTHGRRGLPRWFFGSVAECIAENSHVPVVVIPDEGAANQSAG